MRFDLPADQMPTAWFNVLPVMPAAAAAAAAPGHAGAGRPRRPRAAVPDGSDRPGGVGRAVDRHPRRGARHPAAVAADAARARRAPRARARHAGAHLLQGRVGVARGVAQAEHRRTAGVLQQGGGHPAPHHRDRRRAVGHRARRSRARSSTSSARCTWCARRTQQKPYRKILMETWGSEVVPSPVDDPDHPGSLGLAISDAVRDAATRDDTHYALGSVLNHVLLHQTIIGLEAKEQLALAGETRPDVVIGVVRRRLEPRRHRAAVRRRTPTCASSRWSRRRARRSPKDASSTTSATPPA